MWFLQLIIFMNVFIYIIIILIFLISLSFIGFKVYEVYKLNGFRGLIIEFIVRAENIFEYGMNNEKFNSVFNGIYNKLPNYIKAFISEDKIKSFIQKTFNEIKVALDNKPKNN